VEPDLVELRVNACSGSGTLAHQHGSVAEEGGLFALFDGLGMDLGNEAGQAHTGEEFGVEIIALVGGVGDGPKPLGMGENEVDA
jgi:hypothetical protein